MRGKKNGKKLFQTERTKTKGTEVRKKLISVNDGNKISALRNVGNRGRRVCVRVIMMDGKPSVSDSR